MRLSPFQEAIEEYESTPEETELRELVKSIGLFIDNYRRMYARTAYAPRVEAAAGMVKQKLCEL